MPPLDPGIRKELERTVIAARGVAEDGARAALDVLAFGADSAPAGTSLERREQRKALRARARVLGEGSVELGRPLLVEEIAYEAWHRLLFARFLAENHLLIHPDYDVPVTLEECAELAAAEPNADRWDVAARFAAAMLPGLFRADDPAVHVRFAREHRTRLEELVAGLDPDIFQADDGLGWVYQFWQAKRREEVNRSGRKIGGADIAPVTQLFTEDYMVRFLLENSLGAWWAARHPDSPLLRGWEYLRLTDDGAPAAGSFPGWPERAAEVTVIDPCCGSGHFLVRAFQMLRAMRQEEGLTPAAAADAVLRDNLFGLELDPRCTQIAAFAVALEAWKAGGDPRASPPQVACSGVPVKGSLAEWRRLAGDDDTLRHALEQLYALFTDAPTLGSLIDPRRTVEQAGLFKLDWDEVERLVAFKLAPDVEEHVFGRVAGEAAVAASLLGRRYTLVATNVPFLKRGNQDPRLKTYCECMHWPARHDLATVMMERFRDLARGQALVLPQTWTFLGSYQQFRTRLISEDTIHMVAFLGSSAFETISGEVVKIVLMVLSTKSYAPGAEFLGIDVAATSTPVGKARTLAKGGLTRLSQSAQLKNPDARILLSQFGGAALLDMFAESVKGLTTGDLGWLVRYFWEADAWHHDWSPFQGPINRSVPFGGRECLFYWCSGKGPMQELPGSRTFAQGAWGRAGVLVSQMGQLPVTLYTGDPHDNNTAVILPKDPTHLPAIWAFCSSPEFNTEVRKIDQALKVTNASLVKVPFDLDYWTKVAAERYPDGLPEPHSDDPTQWLFNGHPRGADNPLQVAVARLLGYHWPEQPEQDELERHADRDGIVCLKPVRGEPPAADRLLALLADAWGDAWSPTVLDDLLAGAGFAGRTLDDWLADGKGFFHQHCRLFHNRPFVWHIWDGARDGFSALVNCHRLDRQTLDKLVNSYIGDWISTQRALAAAGEAGADTRLAKATELKQKLEVIQRGDPPHDVYVRWKPLHRQPIGWGPDLNDGVRLNIRPFVIAGVLRAKFSVSWNKDRGDNPAGSDTFNWAREAQLATVPTLPPEQRLFPDLGRERLNDLHLSRAVKQAARDAAEPENAS